MLLRQQYYEDTEVIAVKDRRERVSIDDMLLIAFKLGEKKNVRQVSAETIYRSDASTRGGNTKLLSHVT